MASSVLFDIDSHVGPSQEFALLPVVFFFVTNSFCKLLVSICCRLRSLVTVFGQEQAALAVRILTNCLMNQDLSAVIRCVGGGWCEVSGCLYSSCLSLFILPRKVHLHRGKASLASGWVHHVLMLLYCNEQSLTSTIRSKQLDQSRFYLLTIFFIMYI